MFSICDNRLVCCMVMCINICWYTCCISGVVLQNSGGGGGGRINPIIKCYCVLFIRTRSPCTVTMTITCGTEINPSKKFSKLCVKEHNFVNERTKRTFDKSPFHLFIDIGYYPISMNRALRSELCLYTQDSVLCQQNVSAVRWFTGDVIQQC